ncbi:flagellar FliL protein [Acetobacter estunensis NRIC 0472]|uniref:Flagellar protein FliL n=1 Tax=Acetobacter estunensis TaxID=104097 RepID=A0A967B2J0_9PROT|nr:flagellar basal body-associated FliL family protein [Acetobacter estunensis]NHO52550.1 flagellar FliL protein [Acetobacter estunensis]GBQ26292.1 flagellar FliL protein [Acetobacter estunensis NRIC 0472]
MAEEEETEGAVAPPPKKKKKLVLIAGAAVAVALLGGGGWFYRQHSAAKPEKTPPQAVVQQEPFLVDIPTVISNLDSSTGRPVFVKISAKLQVRGTTRDAVDALMPEIQNVFQTYLHESTQSDLGGNGIYRLREALLARLVVQLAPIEVRDLLFTEFLIQ